MKAKTEALKPDVPFASRIEDVCLYDEASGMPLGSKPTFHFRCASPRVNGLLTNLKKSAIDNPQ